MSRTAFTGPITVFPDPVLSGAPANQNPDQGPSQFNAGWALLDPRQQYTYIPGAASGKASVGWNATDIEAVSQTASALLTNNIVTVQTATSGTNLTLTAGTGVTGAVSITRADTGVTVTGLLALDGAATWVAFGSSASIAVWDPTTMLARNVRIGITGNDTTGSYLVSGFDAYGFPMTETITPNNATGGTFSGKKAFKYIQSVKPSGTIISTSTVVGTGDVYGFPLRVDDFGHISIMYANSWLTSTATTGTFTGAVTTTATATSGDVRGTFAIGSASNGTSMLQIWVSVKAANLASQTGLLGVTQA